MLALGGEREISGIWAEDLAPMIYKGGAAAKPPLAGGWSPPLCILWDLHFWYRMGATTIDLLISDMGHRGGKCIKFVASPLDCAKFDAQ